MNNHLRWGTDIICSKFVFCFVLVLVPIAFGCDAGPPPAVVPVSTLVDTERFSKPKLTFQDEIVVKNNHLILEKGKEYEYSGSFQLAQMDDEVPEYKEFSQRIRETLLIIFTIDRDKSGYTPRRPDRPVQNKQLAREITTGAERVSNSWIESPNLIHFKGRLEAPSKLGEHELRLAFLPKGAQERVYILTRLVQVVEAKEPNGTNK